MGAVHVHYYGNIIMGTLLWEHYYGSCTFVWKRCGLLCSYAYPEERKAVANGCSDNNGGGMLGSYEPRFCFYLCVHIPRRHTHTPINCLFWVYAHTNNNKIWVHSFLTFLPHYYQNRCPLPSFLLGRHSHIISRTAHTVPIVIYECRKIRNSQQRNAPKRGNCGIPGKAALSSGICPLHVWVHKYPGMSPTGSHEREYR